MTRPASHQSDDRESLYEDRLPIGGQAHHFVFAGIDLESGIVAKGGVQEAERMREINFL